MLLNAVDQMNARFTLVDLTVQAVPKARSVSTEVDFLNGLQDRKIDFKPVVNRNSQRIKVKVLLAV